MTLGTITCSCGGENPHCYRCSGTGLHAADAQESLARSALTGVPNKRLRGKKSDSVVPQIEARAEQRYADWRLTQRGWNPLWENLKDSKKDLWRQLAESDLKPTPKSPELIGRGLQPKACPICHRPGCLLRSHETKSRPISPRREAGSGKRIKSAVPPPQRNMHQCPQCNSAFKSLGQLDSHILKAHGMNAVREFWEAHRRALSSERSVEAESTRSDSKQNFPDATLGWGGSFRDHGQFGSHPAFDAMDDESTA